MSKIIHLLLLLFISASVYAQISSPTSDFKVATTYSAHDSIFVFNQNTVAKNGVLRATTPVNSPATFEWSRYDTLNHVFLPSFQTDVNINFSVVNNLNPGGYRVHVTSPGLDTTMLAWVFLNSFTFTVEKNNAGEVHFFRRTCEYTNLQSNAVTSEFTYFNPADKNRFRLNNSVTITWTASPATGGNLGTGAKIWIEGDDLPTEDTEYTARAADNFGLVKEDKVKYISIIPRADFETTYKKKYSDSIASAPVLVEFTNNSRNSVKYTWIFGDGDTSILKEPEKTPEPHIYYFTVKDGQEYKIKLIAESKEMCTREDTATIKVNAPELDAPNFFSPGNDQQNNIFVIRNASMREFHLTIFTRSGRKVYEFHGPDINSWDGWDGTMGGNGGTKLSSGIYYYVLEAISWEQPGFKYKPTQYSKFVYLFRDK